MVNLEYYGNVNDDMILKQILLSADHEGNKIVLEF